jgi:hypothetical protein
VADALSDDVSILPGDGTGRVRGHSAFAIGSTARGIDAADLDGDLAIDLVVAVSSQDVVKRLLRVAGRGVGLVLTPLERVQGDVDGDCRVNDFDLLILLSEWGEVGSPADVDGDGAVGVNDLLVLLATWSGRDE